MCDLTILMPCLNEEATLGSCIRKAKRFLAENEIDGEVLIADNGSKDASVEIAMKEGARVLKVKAKGYGSALMGGIESAKGRYIIMGDADDSYDFQHLEPFIVKLRAGYDLVMGNRFAGGIKDGAMPFLHRYLGNPVLSFLGRLFFKSNIRDFHCGLRGFNRERILNLSLQTPGMEFASEMAVKATLLQYRITEVPTTLSRDGRQHPPHLNTWRDGWRHLVFLLMYSPRWLFLIPSMVILILSALCLTLLLPGSLSIHHVSFDIHSLILSGFLVVTSYQLLLFAIFIKIYSINQGFYPATDNYFKLFKYFTLEKGILTGLLFSLSGFFIFLSIFSQWAQSGFGPILNIHREIRILIPSLTLMTLGVQTIFGSFFLRILGINPKIIIPHEGH